MIIFCILNPLNCVFPLVALCKIFSFKYFFAFLGSFLFCWLQTFMAEYSAYRTISVLSILGLLYAKYFLNL